MQNAMMNKTIYIAEDHEILAQGIGEFLAEKVKIVTTFLNGTELKRSLKSSPPDFLILDLNLPGVDGLEILKYINHSKLPIKTIVLTMYNEPSLIEKCKNYGAAAYLLKTTSYTDLLDALESDTFVYGKGVKNKHKAEHFHDRFLEKKELTSREIQVIRLLSKDHKSESIANELSVSVHTINTHRRNIKMKLKIETTAGIVAFGYENNLITG